MHSLTIGIIGYNDSKNLNILLKKIEKSKKPNNCIINIIYVDDGSVDNSKKVLQKYQSKFNTKLIDNGKNAGRAFSRNQIIKHNNSEWIFFMNSNVLPIKKDFILDIALSVSHQPLAQMCSIKYQCSDGAMQSYLNLPSRGINKYDHNQKIHYKYLLFSCCLIRAAIFDDVNLLFNESFFAYGGEELDLASRINSKYENKIFANKQLVFMRNNHPALRKHSKRLVAFGRYNLPKLSINNQLLLLKSHWVGRFRFVLGPLVSLAFFLFMLIYKLISIKGTVLIKAIWFLSILQGYCWRGFK